MTAPRIILKSVEYTSQQLGPVSLELDDGLNLIYGASNTGKSFFVKTVDFMLGASRDLPETDERLPFDRIKLSLAVPDRKIDILRAMAGGAFEVLELPNDTLRRLAPKHDPNNDENLSTFLLQIFGLKGKKIATKSDGAKRTLSFRDLARYCIVDETIIQSETSPIEGGQRDDRTVEHSVFKLLLTGQDDSAVVAVVDRKTFKTSKVARSDVIQEMLDNVVSELEREYPNFSDLESQYDRLEQTYSSAVNRLRVAEKTVTGLLARKRDIAVQIVRATDRLGGIRVNLQRFSQLSAIYKSDAARLTSLEEAAFLLALGGEKDCPLCGAPPESQLHKHTASEIDHLRGAAKAEVGKVQALDSDLSKTVAALQAELQILTTAIPELRIRLGVVESEISQSAPATNDVRQEVAELLEVRDRIRQGLELLKQKHRYEELLAEIVSEKQPKKADKPKLGVPGPVAYDFAQLISEVLKKWHFPGQCNVSFDDATYDFRIDGKLRRDNGKGVRAITHAAVKVALLLFCRERSLPHPGFLVLDTPLLTYRDPLTSKAGELTQDEQDLAVTSLKDFFFQHLLELKGFAQTVILENIDPPQFVFAKANTIVFHGEGGERPGLFPPKRHHADNGPDAHD